MSKKDIIDNLTPEELETIKGGCRVPPCPNFDQNKKKKLRDVKRFPPSYSSQV